MMSGWEAAGRRRVGAVCKLHIQIPMSAANTVVWRIIAFEEVVMLIIWANSSIHRGRYADAEEAFGHNGCISSAEAQPHLAAAAAAAAAAIFAL